MKHNNEKISLTVNRLGEFVVHDTSDHPNQCGTVGKRIYKYRVSITGDSNNLNEKGFIIDNVVVHDYFQGYYNNRTLKSDSCELMACACIDFLKQYCAKNKVKGISKVVVELWGSDHSFITAEWNK